MVYKHADVLMDSMTIIALRRNGVPFLWIHKFDSQPGDCDEQKTYSRVYMYIYMHA